MKTKLRMQKTTLSTCRLDAAVTAKPSNKCSQPSWIWIELNHFISCWQKMHTVSLDDIAKYMSN